MDMRLLMAYVALAVCGAAEVREAVEAAADGEPGASDQDASETGHRRARLWRKVFKSLYAHGHQLAYPAAYLLGSYAKHLGHNRGHHHHHNKGPQGYHQGHGLGHLWGQASPFWGHGPPLNDWAYDAHFDGGHYNDHHIAGPFGGLHPEAHTPLYEGHHAGLYPEGEWWGSAWDGYGWGDHSSPHDGFWT